MRKLRKQSERNNNPPTPIKLIPAKSTYLYINIYVLTKNLQFRGISILRGG